MPIQSAQQLLVHELQSIQDAEKQAARALHSRLEEIEDEDLRDLLERRLEEGKQLLQDVGKSLEKLDGGGRIDNKAARGLIEEAEEAAEEAASPAIKEAIIIAGAQKLEHYCIAAWGTVKSIASELEQEDLAQAMQRALEEGYRWDEQLTELAEGSINPEAIETAEEEEDQPKRGGRKGSD